jgi:hypothetical protein
MEAIQRNGRESSDGRSQTAEVMGRLVATRRRVVAEKVEPLKAEAERAAQEIETLRDTARRKVWEVGEIRRFVVTTATPEGRMLRPLDD